MLNDRAGINIHTSHTVYVYINCITYRKEVPKHANLGYKKEEGNLYYFAYAFEDFTGVITLCRSNSY